jgi:hypothetical protein
MSNSSRKAHAQENAMPGKSDVPHRKDSPANGSQEESRSIPAIRHVGKTLESEPGYLERENPEGLTPEAQIAAQAGNAEPPIREIAEAEVDPISGQVRRIDIPERLKTRLPGDTSSDPHTDVGPDNAATVQRRGELPREGGAKKKHAA